VRTELQHTSRHAENGFRLISYVYIVHITFYYISQKEV
jgi:hypothetical protein